MIAPGDLIGAVIFLALMLTIVVIGEAWARLGSPDPEVSRKFVHLASAAACLILPLLIESPFVVGGMAVGLSGFFLFTGYYRLLKSLHGVKRKSLGSECYTVAIFLVFLLAADNYWIYVVSILVLGVADASAALVGIKYGRFRYNIQSAVKSMEGSFAFFTIVFFAVLIPSPFLVDLAWANLLHIAFAMALLLTCVEAVSIHGADNLFVPVAAAVLLEKLSVLALPVLLIHNLSLVALFAVAFFANLLLRACTSGEDAPFEGGAIMVFALFTYGAWTLAGAPWVIPVIAAFLVAIIAWAAVKYMARLDLSIRIRPTFRAVIVPFALILIAHVTGAFEEFYGPYLTLGSAVLSFAIFGLWRPNPETRGPGYSIGFAAAIGLVAGTAFAVPVWALFPQVGWTAPATIIAVVVLFSAINYRIVERRVRSDHEFFWPASHVGLAALAGLIVYLAQYGEILPVWELPEGTDFIRTAWEFWR